VLFFVGPETEAAPPSIHVRFFRQSGSAPELTVTSENEPSRPESLAPDFKKYSGFEERRARDEVRSALRGLGGSLKSPSPNSGKCREIPPTFQRAFSNREYASSNPPRSATHSAFQRSSFLTTRKARQMRAFPIAQGLQRRSFALFRPRTLESLQPNPTKLPFSRDSLWRP
jgi:hypothetical protein